MTQDGTPLTDAECDAIAATLASEFSIDGAYQEYDRALIRAGAAARVPPRDVLQAQAFAGAILDMYADNWASDFDGQTIEDFGDKYGMMRWREMSQPQDYDDGERCGNCEGECDRCHRYTPAAEAARRAAANWDAAPERGTTHVRRTCGCFWDNALACAAELALDATLCACPCHGQPNTGASETSATQCCQSEPEPTLVAREKDRSGQPDPPQAASPVAWQIDWSGGRTYSGHNAVGDYRAVYPDATSTPLYAAAPLPAADALTDKQISAGVEAWFTHAGIDINNFAKRMRAAINAAQGKAKPIEGA